MRFPKPPDPTRPDPRNDPSLFEWEDGRIWQHDGKGGWKPLYTPPPAPYSPREGRKSTEIDWSIILYGLIALLAIYGLVSLVVGLSDHSIGCHLGSTQGCYITIPGKTAP